MLIPIILSGGSGTRLWPLSTPDRPKQFLPLVGDRTLFQETLKRLDKLPGLAPPIVVCNAAHCELVAAQLSDLGIEPAAIVLEPEGRNTAPAIAVAALLATGRGTRAAGTDAGPDPVLLVLPADHLIVDVDAFGDAVAQAVRAAEAGRLVTFGVVPTAPETGYGYIERGPSEGDWFAVARFVEKPDRATAERCVAAGRFLWNSGMFVFGAGQFLSELARHAPAIHSGAVAAARDVARSGSVARLGPQFLACPSDSIDYAVMEKTDRAAVVPLSAGWSDVGSWSALFDALEKDGDRNVLQGSVTALDSRNSLVISGLRRIALLGVDDLVVIDTGDSLLVMRKDRSQRIKELIPLFQEGSSSQEKQ